MCERKDLQQFIKNDFFIGQTQQLHIKPSPEATFQKFLASNFNFPSSGPHSSAPSNLHPWNGHPATSESVFFPGGLTFPHTPSLSAELQILSQTKVVFQEFQKNCSNWLLSSKSSHLESLPTGRVKDSSLVSSECPFGNCQMSHVQTASTSPNTH